LPDTTAFGARDYRLSLSRRAVGAVVATSSSSYTKSSVGIVNKRAGRRSSRSVSTGQKWLGLD
jgi:hypothetical protein